MKLKYDIARKDILSQPKESSKNKDGAYMFYLTTNINCVLLRLKHKVLKSNEDFEALEAKIDETYKELSTTITKIDAWRMVEKK